MKYEFSQQVASVEDNLVTHAMNPNSHVSYISLNPEGGAANQSLQTFSYKPSQGSMINRRIYLQMPVTLKVNNEAANAEADFGANTAPRQFPVNSIVQNCEISINNTPVSTNIADLKNAVSLFDTSPDFRVKHHSMTASQPDYSGSMATLVANDLINPAAAIDATRSAELSRLAASGAPADEDKGTAPNTNYVKIRSFVFTELLQHPLLDIDDSVFTNVTQFQMRLNFNTAVANMFAASAASTGALSIELGLPQLLMQIINPPESYNIPPVVDVEYQDRRMVSSTIGNVTTNGTSQPHSIPNTYLNRIPEYVTIWAQPTAANALVAEGLGSIKSLDLRVNNTSGVLSGATKQQLFQISQKNGLSHEFPFRYNTTRGLPIKLKVGEDIPVFHPPNTSNVNFDFSGTVTFENTSLGADTTFTVKIMFEFSNTLQISLSQTMVKAGNSLAQAKEAILAGEEETSKDEMTGGFWRKKHWRKLKRTFNRKNLEDFGRGFHKGFTGTLDVANQLANVANVASNMQGSGVLGGVVAQRPSLRELVGQGRLGN